MFAMQRNIKKRMITSGVSTCNKCLLYSADSPLNKVTKIEKCIFEAGNKKSSIVTLRL